MSTTFGQQIDLTFLRIHTPYLWLRGNQDRIPLKSSDAVSIYRIFFFTSTSLLQWENNHHILQALIHTIPIFSVGHFIFSLTVLREMAAKTQLTAPFCLHHYEPEPCSFQTCQKQTWISCYYYACGKHWKNWRSGSARQARGKTLLCASHVSMQFTPNFLFKVIFPIITIINKMRRTKSDPNLLPNRRICGSYRSSWLQEDFGSNLLLCFSLLSNGYK